MACSKNLGRPWIHETVMCDECSVTPIIGYRMKCETCANHDLCVRCFEKWKKSATQSACKFLEVHVDSAKFYPPFQIRYYSCDECFSMPIQGPRYGNKWRPNYDLCSDCFLKSTEPEDSFQKMEETEIHTLCRAYLPVFHFHKQCMQCGQNPICGPRFDMITILPGLSLCLICFDKMFDNGALTAADCQRIDRPEADQVIHLSMFCCLQCGEIPICGPAYVNTGIANDSLCLQCYQHMDPTRWQYEYKRVEAPRQYGDPPLATETQAGQQSADISQLLEALKLQLSNATPNGNTTPNANTTSDNYTAPNVNTTASVNTPPDLDTFLNTSTSSAFNSSFNASTSPASNSAFNASSSYLNPNYNANTSPFLNTSPNAGNYFTPYNKPTYPFSYLNNYYNNATTPEYFNFAAGSSNFSSSAAASNFNSNFSGSTSSGFNSNSNGSSYSNKKDEGDEDIGKLNNRLNSAVVEEKPNVTWDDVAGLEGAKQALQEAVVFPIKFPQFFEGDRKPWNAFLLYGPPGTGKSYLAKAVATEVSSTFFSVSASDLGSKWHGESEKLVSELFKKARERSPSIIFIDEIDSIAGTRSEEDQTGVKTEILVQMQGVGKDNKKVLVLAATNLPYKLDQAIRRRFDKRIYIPLPEKAARKEIFKIHLKKTPHALNDADFDYLAAKTPGFSGSDISVCVKDVLWVPLRKIQTAEFFRMDRNSWYPCEPNEPGAVKTTLKELEAKNLTSMIKLTPISRADFEKTLEKQKPTVSKADLALHHKFTKEFGEEGTTAHDDGETDDFVEMDEESEKLEGNLETAIVRVKPNVKWSDVAGLESVKQALREAVVLPIKHPQFFTGNRKPWNSFLLYGPPGTGKSYVAKAVATEVESTFFSISSSDLASKWHGESEKLVACLFQKARKCAPSIIFIDEIDSICGTRGATFGSEVDKRVKTEMLVQMQGVGNNNEKVLILAATNLPYSLDPAIRRRFDKRIYIPLPDHVARVQLLKLQLGQTEHWLTEQDFDELAWRTEGFSGSDIAVCVKSVLFEPIRKVEAAWFFKQIYTTSPATKGQQLWTPCSQYDQGAFATNLKDLEAKGWGDKVQLPAIVRADFEATLAKQSPTVSPGDLELHLSFTREFGEEG